MGFISTRSIFLIHNEICNSRTISQMSSIMILFNVSYFCFSSSIKEISMIHIILKTVPKCIAYKKFMYFFLWLHWWINIFTHIKIQDYWILILSFKIFVTYKYFISNKIMIILLFQTFNFSDMWKSKYSVRCKEDMIKYVLLISSLPALYK